MEFDRFILVTAYVPNSKMELKRLDYRINEWDADFMSYLKNLEVTKKKPVVLAGDLNVAHNEIDVYDSTGRNNYPGFSPDER
jgi:exonuclease III